MKATRLIHADGVVVRTRTEVRGSCSELGDGGGAVALKVTLLSCHGALPEHGPLSSYRLGGPVKRGYVVRRCERWELV